MAKDVKKTQKKNEVKGNNKKFSKKDVLNEEKNIEEVVETKVVKNEKRKNNNEKNSVVKVVDDNRRAILFGVVGFLVATLLFRCILWPDRIATLKDGTQPIAHVNGDTITADDLYTDMKKMYSVNILLNKIDDMILVEKYPEDNDMTTEIKETAEYYYSMYEQYQGITKEQFLTENGFASEEEFFETLKLDYRRNKYFDSYVEGLIEEKDIEKYYEKDVFGDVDSKHILVKISQNSEEGLTDEEAKKLANEIIKKLNDGKTWDEVTKEYKDKIVTEELGYNAFNASLESSYLEECKKLEVGKYSKTPVLTSYGYHIVYKIDQKEKPALKDVKDDVLEILATKKKKDDTALYNKSLVVMREEAKLEFEDTKLGDEYNEYIKNYK